jgi:GDP-L-fucose synthase
MPFNLYGPGDNFDLTNSHVLPALIRNASGAKELVVWGTKTPRRELLYSDDLAQACVFLLNLDIATFSTLFNDENPILLNIRTGDDVTIRELAKTVTRVVGFGCEFVFDTTKPTVRHANFWTSVA